MVDLLEIYLKSSGKKLLVANMWLDLIMETGKVLCKYGMFCVNMESFVESIAERIGKFDHLTSY